MKRHFQYTIESQLFDQSWKILSCIIYTSKYLIVLFYFLYKNSSAGYFLDPSSASTSLTTRFSSANLHAFAASFWCSNTYLHIFCFFTYNDTLFWAVNLRIRIIRFHGRKGVIYISMMSFIGKLNRHSTPNQCNYSALPHTALLTMHFRASTNFASLLSFQYPLAISGAGSSLQAE